MKYSKMNLHGGNMNRVGRQNDKLLNNQLPKTDMLDIKPQKINTSLKPISVKFKVNRTRY
jgi:hypothetical protein